MYCQSESAINVLNVDTGLVTQTIGGTNESEEVDSIQTFTTDGNRVVTSHKSGLLKVSYYKCKVSFNSELNRVFFNSYGITMES